MKMSLFFIMLLVSMLFTGCSIIPDNNEEINEFEEMDIEVPQALELTEEELELVAEISKTEENVNVQSENNEVLDPYDAYDAYMAFAQGITIDEAAYDREIDLWKIIMGTTSNTMAISEFDDYTLIALLYYVHIDGNMKDIYDNCNSEEDVKNYLIDNYNYLGNLKFSKIINEHKFER